MRTDFLKLYNTFLFDLDGTLVDSKPGIINSLAYTLKQFGIEENDKDKLNSFIGPPVHYSLTTNYGLSREQADQAVAIYRARYAENGMFECSVYPGVYETLSALKDKGFCLCLATSKLTRFAVEMVYDLGFDRYFSFVQGGDRAARIGGGWDGGISPVCGNSNVGSKSDGSSRISPICCDNIGNSNGYNSVSSKSDTCRNNTKDKNNESSVRGDYSWIQDGEVINKSETVRICLDYAYSKGASPSTTLMVGDRMYDAVGAVSNGIDCAGLLWGYGTKEELKEAGAKYILPDISSLIK